MKLVLMKELVKEANRHLNLYEKNIPEISDREYDKIIEQIETLEKETGIRLSNSPTKIISNNSNGEIKHLKKMLSLKKTKDKNDLKFSKPFITQPKIDGLSLELVYRDGELQYISSRGSGEYGEKKLIIPNIPKKLENVPSHYAIYGEGVISKANWEKHKGDYSTARNLVAGILNSKGHPLDKIAEFVAYSDSSQKGEMALLAGLEQSGFKTPTTVVGLPEDLLKFVEDYEFPVDGVVSKLISYEDKQIVGETSKNPRWAFAYKFEDETRETVLTGIEYKTSRNGVVTPVAVFDTVIIDGTEVNRASLSNLRIIRDLKLGIGDKIVVQKSNMIIPKIVENLTKSNTYKPIAECPNCGAKLGEFDNVLKCNNKGCHELEKISYFCSRSGLNMKGLSLITLKKINSVCPISNIADLYNIDYSKVIKLQGFGEKSINNIREAIEKSKNATIIDFFSALGIKQLSKSRIQKIYNNQSFEEFLNILKSDFSYISGFGGAIVSEVNNFIKENEELINKLKNIFSFSSDNKNENEKMGISFCLTGRFLEKKKDIAEKIKEKYKWIEKDDVTKDLDILIVQRSDFTSTKVDKARKYGIKIQSLDELFP